MGKPGGRVSLSHWGMLYIFGASLAIGFVGGKGVSAAFIILSILLLFNKLAGFFIIRFVFPVWSEVSGCVSVVEGGGGESIAVFWLIIVPVAV